MHTARVIKALADERKDEPKGYRIDSETFIPFKNEPNVEITVGTLTFMISVDNDWTKDNQWKIRNHWMMTKTKDLDEAYGYRVEILEPSAGAYSDKYHRPCDYTFSINKKDLEIFKKELESKSLDKASEILHRAASSLQRLAGKRVIDAVKCESLFQKEIANDADNLYGVADYIIRMADKKLIQSHKASVDAPAGAPGGPSFTPAKR